MDSIKKFMDIFETKRVTSSWSEMTAILKECHQYFKNVPASEKGVILSILFNERKGLLSFLMDALEQPLITKELEAAMNQTFILLVPIMNKCADDYKPYIKPTMVVLKLALIIKSSWFLKNTAVKTFIEFILVFKSLDLDFNPIVNECVKKLHLYSIQAFVRKICLRMFMKEIEQPKDFRTADDKEIGKKINSFERRLILQMLSVISLYFPQTEAFGRSGKTILRQLLADFTEMYEAKKSVQCFSSYIESLNNMLRNFPPSVDDSGSTAASSLYRLLKNLCNSKENHNNKSLMLEVIKLLSIHLSLFDEHVYADYEFWHMTLKNFINKELYGDAAIEALRNYYRTMGSVLGRKSSAQDKKVFLNLHESFLKSLAHNAVPSNVLRLVVYGFSQIIEPCKQYLASAGVQEMFSLIFQRSIPLYSCENDEDTRFEELADYQEALSRIIRYLENVSIDQMRALMTLCSLMIKRFPELSVDDQRYATSSLNRTIINVRYTKEIFYQDFITNILYDGIVWSCSHMLLIDADVKRDMSVTTENLITYKDYVPLWRGLLNPENYTFATENSETRGAALQMVVDEIVTTCIRLISTLNLNISAKSKESVFDDEEMSQVPSNKTDFRIFLNLVDLYVDILPSIEHHLWSNMLEKFIYELIKNSYKNPLISGFYKLVNATLASSGVFHQDESSDFSTNETFNLILQYLWNAMDALPHYPQELQISCLQLVLNIPETFVPRIVDRAVPAFRISLNLGLTNYEIATAALTALERWYEYLGAECPKNFISQIVPCLAMFLQSEESSERLVHDIEETRRRRGGKDAKNLVTLVDDEKTVQIFQKRILLFFGALDNETMSEFIHSRSLKTGATWSKKDLLKYPMPFPDADIDVNLDSMLPRIIELAQSSGDRRTRIAAGEVLHTIVAFMLGKTVPLLSYDKDRFASIYETLCPALLRLGCDSDDVIIQLYHPLMLQLTHWLTSSFMLDSLTTIHFVDSIFEGLSDETNSSLRDASAVYLAEFVHWSIKQSSDKRLAQCPKNIELVVRRIVEFGLDPSMRKRVAAAIAFNHLYRILREKDEIVNTFWLVIFHAFVKSLDGCDDVRIDDSLKHVQRVFIEKSTIFNKTDLRRQQPSGFEGVTMIDTLKWIFQQCTSLDRNCRRKCINIFVTLSPTVEQANSPKAIVSKYLETHEITGLNRILIDHSSSNFNTATSQGLMIFQRTLDLYIWLIRDNLIDPEILFTDVNPQKMIIFHRIRDFVLESLSIIDSLIVENKATSNLRDFVHSKTRRCETILALFDFILVILEVKATNSSFIPDEIFDDNYFSLVVNCLTKPQKLGFDSSNLQLTEQLPSKLESLIVKSVKILSPDLMTRMTKIFAKEIEKLTKKLFNFDDMMDSKVWINENSLKGVILLEKCGILKMCNNCEDLTSDASKKIIKMFNLLKNEEFEKSVCFYPKSETKIYLQNLMELLLIDYDIDTMKTIVELVTNTSKLHRSDMTIVTHGEHFFGFFKIAIVHGFLKEPETTLNLLENTIKLNPDNVLRMIEAIVLHLQRNKNNNKEIMEKCVKTIIEKFSVFERSVNNIDYRKNIFLNIYAIVVRLGKNQLIDRDCDLYRWLLSELVSCQSFKYKIRLLEDFLICLADETLDDSPELTAVLGNLKNERKFINPEEKIDKKRATTETINYFQIILKLLPITRSTIVLDAIINFSSGAGEVFCEDDKIIGYLKLYYDALDICNVLKSLQLIYKRFMTSTNTNERLDVLRYFLLPSLNQCAQESIKQFFELNIRDIYSTIMEKATLNINDRNKLFVSKIASYNLMEIMFANLSRDHIDSTNNSLTIDTHGSESVKDEKLSRKIFRSTLPVRQLIAIEGDDKEIVRLVHCAAYKCCITIVSTTRDERFYLAVFGENREKKQLIWENIIDVNRKYDLRQTSKKYPKEREKLVNIKKTSSGERTSDDHYSYIKSYDLATSTLNENISAYDLNSVNLIPRKNIDSKKNETMSLTLEIDDLNEHECMPLICGLLKHMHENICSNNDEINLPKWMSQFRASMWSEQANVRLFLLKVVLNTQSIFRPYAKYFLEPVTNTIYKCLKENDSLNYLITDALIMLVDWREISLPNTEVERNLAKLMFAYLMEKSTAAPTRYIVKYNLSLIELIVDAWHDCLVVPESLKDRITRDDRTALKFILIFLTNKMFDKIVNRNDVWDFVVQCLSDWKNEEVTVLQSYEAAGLILKYTTTSEQYETRKTQIIETVSSVFRTMQISKPDRLIKCIHSLCKACNNLTNDFFQFVSSVQLRVEPTNIAKCLEIFSLIVPNISKEEIVKELTFMRFNTFLENKVLACEQICLRIVHQLVDILESREISSLVKLVASYSNHEVLEYRQLCHEVFVKVYKKYTSEEITFDNENKETMINVSKKVLLSGLLDPSEDIQKASFAFWSDVVNLRDKSSERFLDILDTYSSGVERNFLQIITLMLLEFTRKSINCDKKMFEPLHNCTYNDHEISVSWKSRNYGSKIPLYAPSLASQLNQKFAQYGYAAGTFTWNDQDSQENNVLRATDAPQFETTYLSVAPTNESLNGNESDNGIFAVPKVPPLSQNKISRRFLAEWLDITVEMKKREESRRTLEMEYRRENLARQRGRVKLYRKYRIGDFPDVEISHSTILGPLQELAKRDPHVCKNLLVTLSRSLIEQRTNADDIETYKTDVSERFTRILADERENGGVVATILEILFDARGLKCPWSIIAKVAKNDRLHAQGAILVEQSLIPEAETSEPPAKRARIINSEDNDETKERWIELAGLYESMNELDIVLGIFRGDIFTEDLHCASLARASNDWATAEKFYRKAFESEIGEQTKQHCLQGTFECLSRLGQWKHLERDIETRINGNFSNLLLPDTNESRWIEPWVFRTCTQRILEGRGNEQFILAMQTFLNDPTTYQSLKENYGEETAIIISSKTPERCHDFVNGSWEKIRQMWLRVSPLAVPLRLEAVGKLRGIYDIDKYLRTLDSSELPDSTRKLTRQWKNRMPSIQDDLLPWQIDISYRSYFSDNLIKVIGDNESQESTDLVKDIHSSITQQMLKLIDCSLCQKNENLTKKYLLRVDERLAYCHSRFLNEYELGAVRYKFLQAQKSSKSSDISKHYSSAWTKIHEILDSDSLNVQGQIAIRKVLSEVSMSLVKLANDKPDLFENLASRTKIVQDIFTERIDFDNVGDTLNYYCFTNLLKCCNLAPQMADCHLHLSKYCYESISSGNCDIELSREFVRSTLRAMSCGSEEATYYFPCLLKERILSSNEIQGIFIDESANVETWRFLIWQTQILSHLSTRIGPVVMPIVKRMIETYPNAMVYSLRLVLDTSPKITENSFLAELENFLADKREFNQFLQALEYVVPPKNYVEHYLREFLKNLIIDKSKAFERLMSKLYPDDLNDKTSSLYGDALGGLVASFKAGIEAMMELPVDEIATQINSLLKHVYERMRNRAEKTELKFYSPWLEDYVGREIEVPGQYKKNKKPTPRYHAKIVKVESTVKVMQSIRKPIRITILATDGKSYRFLIKFGEDLRLDQRVEQIFDVMNDKLKSDVACSHRRLIIDTYQVFPLSGVLGLIEWIDGTKTLREYINFSTNDDEKRQHKQIEIYEEWIKKAAPGKASSIQYKEALLKYNNNNVIDKMEEIINKTEVDTLRRTFVRLSTCMESFMSIRRNFITTYATMSIVQWILGIGDRHPDNTLIAIESGRCLGIDFGSAFGGGIDQSVPELMPFRLTSQIKGLLEPFNVYDSMGNTMIHVLRALKNSKDSLLACLDVVAHEHLNWEEHIYKLSQEKEKTVTEVKWLPEKKVNIVSKKLNGFKPSTIILEQLAEHHDDAKYFSRYTEVVNGTDSDKNSKRSAIMENNLSPDEQVQCLIEQATDLNVLGRTYVGWAPWL